MLLVPLFLFSATEPSKAWGFNVHKEIADQALILLPSELSDFINEHRQDIIDASIEPDRRKSTDPAEGPRHYDDQDQPHKDRNVLSSSSDYRYGVVSWAVENSTRDLTNALRLNSTDNILRYMGDITHYISDAAQPLHATKNYDGQLTGNNGIHSRYEKSLVEIYWEELFDINDFADVRVIQDPYELSEYQIESGLALVSDLLEADDKAAVEAGNTNSDVYYEELYNRIGDTTKSRLSLAIQNTANLWVTAFCNAGWIEITTLTNSTPLSSMNTTDHPIANSTDSPFLFYVVVLTFLTSKLITNRYNSKV